MPFKVKERTRSKMPRHSKGARRELLERFRVLASLPLAGTGQRERRVNRVAIPRIKSHLFRGTESLKIFLGKELDF